MVVVEEGDSDATEIYVDDRASSHSDVTVVYSNYGDTNSCDSIPPTTKHSQIGTAIGGNNPLGAAAAYNNWENLPSPSGDTNSCDGLPPPPTTSSKNGTIISGNRLGTGANAAFNYCDNLPSPPGDTNSCDDQIFSSNSNDLLDPVPSNLQTIPKRKNPALSKEDKEKKRIEREKLREEKRLQREREKNLKATIALKQRSLKPEEAIKRITVHIDIQIINSSAGTHIIPALQKEAIRYRVESLSPSNTVIWTKVVKESGVDLEKKENQVLEVVGWWDIVSWVSKGELLNHVETLQNGGKVTLLIVGMDKYLNYQANKMNKAMKTALTGNQPRGRKADDDLAAAPVVSADNIEMALTEAQLLANCCHR